MALYNVSTSGYSLRAIGYPAHATSEILNQDAADTDFESIRETRVHWLLQNIATGLSTANTLVTNTALSNGDRLFIRLNNGSIIDTVAASVQQGTSPLTPVMTSNTLPEGVVYTNNSSYLANAYKVFDGDLSTSQVYLAAGQYIQYTFKDNTPHTINQYYVYNDSNAEAWVLEGSIDGVNFSTIDTVSSSVSASDYYTVDSPGAFSTYRLRCTSGSLWMREWALLGDGVTMDTTAITAGETPDQVFKFEDTISFNGAVASEKDIFYSYGNNGLSLYALALYDDVALSGRQLTTRIDFSASGNVATEITGQIYKALA